MQDTQTTQPQRAWDPSGMKNAPRARPGGSQTTLNQSVSSLTRQLRDIHTVLLRATGNASAGAQLSPAPLQLAMQLEATCTQLREQIRGLEDPDA